MKTAKTILKKKRKFINISKRKPFIDKLDCKKIIISTLDDFEKKVLPISIVQTKVSIPATKKINIAMIDLDAYYAIF